MPSPTDVDVGELLRRLVDAGVEFIVVGGAAAVLHGAPITTEDLDIVHRRTPENVSRLKNVIHDLDVHVRELANRRLAPQESALLGEGHVLLSTCQCEVKWYGVTNRKHGDAGKSRSCLGLCWIVWVCVMLGLVGFFALGA